MTRLTGNDSQKNARGKSQGPEHCWASSMRATLARRGSQVPKRALFFTAHSMPKLIWGSEENLSWLPL